MSPLSLKIYLTTRAPAFFYNELIGLLMLRNEATDSSHRL